MRIAIHQPQYMPWLPYFQKIDSCDLFVCLDQVAYQKNGLQNRNMLVNGQGKFWLTVPIEQKLGVKIKDVKISSGTSWRRKHLETIRHSYRRCNSYTQVMEMIGPLFEAEWDKLCNLH
jgi:hypothetical protein